MYFDEIGLRYLLCHEIFIFILPLKLSTIASAVEIAALIPAGTSSIEGVVGPAGGAT